MQRCCRMSRVLNCYPQSGLTLVTDIHSSTAATSMHCPHAVMHHSLAHRYLCTTSVKLAWLAMTLARSL